VDDDDADGDVDEPPQPATSRTDATVPTISETIRRTALIPFPPHIRYLLVSSS
jgi:hypothetical protein